ncbi:MAG: PLP-dependent aminotransferase family protein [Marinobacterium sp.]|nr:PLP-dependent aminotransferase family protein [Marinobacterium sp.]
MKRYQQLSHKLRLRIERGEFHPGSLLPSIRALSQQYQLSRNTVIHALALLEEGGLIQSRPRQGFQVCTGNVTVPPIRPREVTLGATAFSVLGAANRPGILALGSADPDNHWPLVDWLYRRMATSARQRGGNPDRSSHYSLPAGDPHLRHALADHLNATTFSCNSEQIIITQGAQEALSLTLRTVAEPGDLIAVESPCYYGTLQCVEALGLKVLEVPANSVTGIDLDALETTLQQWPVKALLTNPTWNNPLGFNLDPQGRQRLMALANQWDIAVIEDDVFGELSFNGQRISPLKVLDTDERVLYCGSFSKSLDADIRIGWVLPGRYFERLHYLKFVTSIACPGLQQQSLAELLRGRRYRQHLNRVGPCYGERAQRLADDVRRYWPTDTHFILPRGGMLQWFELPEAINSDQLFRQALAEGIGLSPGNLFCTDDRFGHHLRLCFACYRQDKKQQRAIARVGEMMALNLN